MKKSSSTHAVSRANRVSKGICARSLLVGIALTYTPRVSAGPVQLRGRDGVEPRHRVGRTDRWTAPTKDLCMPGHHRDQWGAREAGPAWLRHVISLGRYPPSAERCALATDAVLPGPGTSRTPCFPDRSRSLSRIA